MILPNKYITLNNSLLGIGSVILASLNKPSHVSFLWEKITSNKYRISFDKFILALDFLFVLGLINVTNNNIERVINEELKIIKIDFVKDTSIQFEEFLKSRNLNTRDAIITYMFQICEVLKNDIA
ncbi:ABC-three component system middle component 6 [Priestia megaterium]|uniref:ABC-three component system middle component 6 n=1 Tax=Priestia megaterium TaxID=1404 RepID=UPI00300BD820